MTHPKRKREAWAKLDYGLDEWVYIAPSERFPLSRAWELSRPLFERLLGRKLKPGEVVKFSIKEEKKR